MNTILMKFLNQLSNLVKGIFLKLFIMEMLLEQIFHSLKVLIW